MNSAEIILKQLGGNKFLAMTGSKNLLSDKNTLRMDLVKNRSGANKLWITIEENDTYTMRFFRFTSGKMNLKTFEFSEDQITEKGIYEGIFADQLQEIFTSVTGLDTHL